MKEREGYTQEYARNCSDRVAVDKLDESLEKMREHAMQFPERQISRPVPSIWQT